MYMLTRDRIGIVFCAALLCLLSAPASASVLTADAGNTQPAFAGTGVAGTVDFAVYANCVATCGSADPFGVGGTIKANFTAGTSSGAFDASAKYLYLFETVNNGPNDASFSI